MNVYVLSTSKSYGIEENMKKGLLMFYAFIDFRARHTFLPGFSFVFFYSFSIKIMMSFVLYYALIGYTCIESNDKRKPVTAQIQPLVTSIEVCTCVLPKTDHSSCSLFLAPVYTKV